MPGVISSAHARGPSGSISRPLTVACLLVLAGSSVARAGSAAVLRLADVLAEAAQQSPTIGAARARAAAAAEEPARAAAWDDPTVSYEAWNVPDPNPFRVDRADNNIVRLSQKVPFPGKRALAGRAATLDAEVAARDGDAVALDVAVAVKRAFWDLWEAHQLVDVYERERRLVERLARVAGDRYAAGGVSQSDVIRAQVELTHVTTRSRTQDLRVASARAALDVLLDRAPDAPLAVPEDPPPLHLARDPASLTELALRTRPELLAQRQAITREEAQVALARRNYLPDFEFSVGRFINPGQRDGFGGMAVVSLPLVQHAKYAAGVSQAQARETSARAELRRMEDRVRGEVQEAWLRAHTALLQRELLVGTHVPQAEQSLRVADAGYQAGNIDFAALIDTARTIESVHIEHVGEEAELARAWADLERAVGTELPEGGVQ